ncbi:DNA polymerase epsilon subunit 4 [Anopheles nili]|uniref:DNA polymerase epsilon subunit 4 n=1 Tax=Anopheles nili TaxID=185578 RepID=UPI00237C11A4|nr:DNA polymerase epsilon subunit 4 [Anopheles nili]
MEQEQHSEDMFGTQDDAALQEAVSVAENTPIIPTESITFPVPLDKNGNSVEEKQLDPQDMDTPDLFFSEDMNDKQSEEENIPEESNAADDNVDSVEAPKSNDELSAEVIESSVPQEAGAPAPVVKSSPEERLAQFPFARIKQIMKLDPDVGILSAEAIFLVTRASELFLQTLAKDASSQTLMSKKKTMSKRDVEATIDNVDSLIFLEGMMNV